MQNSKIDPNTISSVYTLHRYYIWANAMRAHFDKVLNEKKPHRKGWDIESRMYMSFWYATLFVVIEGWGKSRLSDSRIDNLLSSPNVSLLRRYRNGVFHFQAQYDDERFIELIRDGENVVEWIRNLNQELGRFFLDRLRETKKCTQQEK